jgi:CheY-like chemotaxis protein
MILKNASILVVDDDPDVLTAVRLLLKTEVKEVITEKNPENLRWHLNKDHFDLILLDMNFTSSIHTGNEGLFWLNEIKKLKTDSAVIMITAYGDGGCGSLVRSADMSLCPVNWVASARSARMRKADARSLSNNRGDQH